MFEGGNDAVDCFLREVFHGEGFCLGEAGSAKDGLAELEHLFRRRGPAVGAEGLDAAEDSGGGFAGDGLMGDGFEKGFVRAIRPVGLDAELLGFFDQRGELRVSCRQGIHCEAQVEWRQAKFLGHGLAPDWETMQKISSFVGRSCCGKVFSSDG